MVVVLIVSALLLLWLYNSIKDKVSNEHIKELKLSKEEMIAVTCFFITVCIRSYVGMILSFSWKSTFYLALLFVLGVVLGKMLGGVIGDKFGFEKITFTLLISAVCFVFSFNNPAIGIFAVLLFNMTMPITLICLSNIFSNNKGMAFGMLTLALFVGVTPTFIGDTHLFTKVGLLSLTMLSVIVLYIGLKFYSKSSNEKLEGYK